MTLLLLLRSPTGGVNLTPTIEMQFSGSTGAWTDVSSDVFANPAIECEYGINGAGPLDLVATPGTLTFALNNGDTPGYYSPESTSKRSGFDLGIGVRFKLANGPSVGYKFVGYLDSVVPVPGQYGSRIRLCTATDWMAEAMRARGAAATIMPGLINSHAHLNWDGIHDLARQSMDDPRPISVFKAAANMLKSLRAGVTMVRDLGFHDLNLYSKQAIEQGIFPGPRVKVCGAAIIHRRPHLLGVPRGQRRRRDAAGRARAGARRRRPHQDHGLPRHTRVHRRGTPRRHRRSPPQQPADHRPCHHDACIERVARFGV